MMLAHGPLKAIRRNCLDCSETRRDVTYCPLHGAGSSGCELWPYRFGKRPETVREKIGRAMVTPALMPDLSIPIEKLPANPADYCRLVEQGDNPTPTPKAPRPLKAIRRHCLSCCDGNAKAVTWCTCDGAHSRLCHLWPYRFGMRPESAQTRYGERIVTPDMMPDANVNLDDLPMVRVKRTGPISQRHSVLGPAGAVETAEDQRSENPEWTY